MSFYVMTMRLTGTLSSRSVKSRETRFDDDDDDEQRTGQRHVAAVGKSPGTSVRCTYNGQLPVCNCDCINGEYMTVLVNRTQLQLPNPTVSGWLFSQ